MAALGGTNLVHDVGYLGSGLIGSLEMILLNSDIAGYIKRTYQGITVNEETLCLDLIDKVGPGGEYMTQPHTFKHYKEETFYPDYMNRKQHQTWKQSGGEDLYAVLNRKAREIIEADTKPLLTEAVLEQYDEIISRRESEVRLGKFHREDFQERR
jgi:trimethylamine--corrinoid protein Co-methyltransferase